MTASTEQIRKDALTLPPAERVALAEFLLESVDFPDAGLEALWLEEAKARLAAYDAGLMESIPAEDVFAEFDGS